jgi:hypothetical protein
MRGNFDSGNLRIATINGIPIYVNSIDGFHTVQEMKEEELIQGGPRTVVYSINKKKINGKISIPLYVDKDGKISEGCKEIIKCADNPTLFFNLKANRGIMHEPNTADIYNSPIKTDKHKRITLECCVVSDLSINIPEQGGITLTVSIIGLPEKNAENDYNISPPTSDMMSRQCTYADCIITTGEDEEGKPIIFKENIKDFNLNFNNKIDELYLLGQNDYASALCIGKTNINGDFTEAVKSSEWDDEYENYNHGGYVDDNKLFIRIADIIGKMNDVLYEPQEQPIAVGLICKKTKFKVVFRYGWINDNNLIFKNM